jgi:hypothetical protein
MRTPELELLWWAGCPSTDRALAELRDTLTELGLDGAEIRMREIRTHAEAVRAAFSGSPTILIDGRDVTSSADDGFGLNCRVYRRRDGRISPTPDPDDLRETLARAAERVEVTR